MHSTPCNKLRKWGALLQERKQNRGRNHQESHNVYKKRVRKRRHLSPSRWGPRPTPKPPPPKPFPRVQEVPHRSFRPSARPSGNPRPLPPRPHFLAPPPSSAPSVSSSSLRPPCLGGPQPSPSPLPLALPSPAPTAPFTPGPFLYPPPIRPSLPPPASSTLSPKSDRLHKSPLHFLPSLTLLSQADPPKTPFTSSHMRTKLTGTPCPSRLCAKLLCDPPHQILLET